MDTRTVGRVDRRPVDSKFLECRVYSQILGGQIHSRPDARTCGRTDRYTVDQSQGPVQGWTDGQTHHGFEITSSWRAAGQTDADWRKDTQMGGMRDGYTGRQTDRHRGRQTGSRHSRQSYGRLAMWNSLVPPWGARLLGPFLLAILKDGPYLWLPKKVKISYYSCRTGPGVSHSFL
jgi:hypothetical protein